MTDPAPNDTSPRLAPPLWSCAIFGLCLAAALAALSVGWGHPILDGDHGFRQTQTAISAHYVIGRRPALAYETPVLGPPWAIPFEFPLFQWVVGSLVTSLGTSLDQTGRLVSVVFFLGCLVPAHDLLCLRRVRPAHRLLALGLLIVSPFYLFWSRAFLIESTALFFTLSYLALALRHREDARRASLLVGLAAGTVAALVKPTTLAPAWLLVIGLTALDAGRALQAGAARGAVRSVCAGLALCAVPAAFGLAWTWYADSLKAANPNASWLTSTALRHWSFGSAAQRLAPETWRVIGQRAGLVVGHPLVLVAGLAALAFARRRRAEVAVCLGLFVSAPLVFTNLHYVHEYYTCANGVFLVAAVAFCVIALAERGGPHARAAGYLFAFAVSLSAVSYVTTYYPRQSARDTRLLVVAEAVRARTEAHDVLVIAGWDWSPEIPYYSGRRALMVPAGQEQRLADTEGCLSALRPYRLGAVLVRRRPGDAAVQAAAARLAQGAGLDRTPAELADGVLLFTRPRPATGESSATAPGARPSAPTAAHPNTEVTAGDTGGSARGAAAPRS